MVTVVGNTTRIIKRCKCSSCSVRLEYTRSEVQYYDDKPYGSSVERVYFIRCPACGNKAIVKGY